MAQHCVANESVMLSIDMLSVVMLNVVILSVVAPFAALQLRFL